MGGWIAVDLDGTLAVYTIWKGADDIGEPIPLMVRRVKKWLEEGKEVRIFTARANVPEQIPPVEAWCHKHLGRVLPITATKDFQMIEQWDDRAVQLITNTGLRVDSK